MKTWTDQEVETLIVYYGTITNDRLHELIPNKTPLAIYKKAQKMGLKMSDEIKFQNRSKAHSGEKSAKWNGGTRTTRSGYRQILYPEHPRADGDGYVMEHILVWEQATGVTVPLNCCIHHLNGNKSDNRIQNLCMMQHTAHTVFHHTGAKRTAEARRKMSERKKKYA